MSNRISDQLKTLREGLAGWAQTSRATVEIGSRLTDLLEMFSEGAPQGVRVRILFTGERKRGEIEECGMVDRDYLVVMTTGRGFITKGDDTRETAGHKPVYDLVDDLRQALRAVQFSTDVEVEARTNLTEQRPDVKSIGLFTIDGRPVDAYQIELSIGTQLSPETTGE